MLSYYEILQVDKNATDVEIKKAYRKLCKILHPDIHNNTKESNVIFNLLHEAYETLSNSDKRRSYNPNQKNSNAYDISHEKYNEIISGYVKIVSDYERIIKSKNKREIDLLEEIRTLKERDNKLDTTDSFNEKSQQSDVFKEENKNEHLWETLLLAAFWIIVVGIFILLVVVPVIWWILIGFIIFIIWVLYSVFR